VRRFATVRVRITLGAVVVVGIALLAGAVWLVHSQRQTLVNSVETTARLRSRDIAATIADGTFSQTLAVPPGDENLVQVVDSKGNVVAASANALHRARISTLAPANDGYVSTTVHHLPIGDPPFRVVARNVATASGTYTVYVAGSLERADEGLENLVQLLFIGLPIMLLLIGATTWVVTGRALHPVEAIRREVEAIGAGDLHRRVPETKTADEIGRLATTMNAMLARLEDATDRQRRFVADASHELRSPLTGIRAQLEVDLAHPDGADWQATERDVLDDALRLQRLVDDLLVLATADASVSDASHRETVDLDEIVLREARRLASRTPHQIDTSGVSGAQLVGNPDQLTRTVRNLLDNAAHYARTTITVTLREDETEATLTVADDGPGIPLDQADRIFERFTRLDDARTRETGGTGLGLAIAHEAVVAHGGTISLTNSPGAVFTVTLPIGAGLRP
jgi:signal transduction histidine kinase